MARKLLGLRIDEEWLAAIRQRCVEEGIDPEPPHGRAGGPAEWVRRLVARELGFEPQADPHQAQSTALKGRPNPHHWSKAAAQD